MKQTQEFRRSVLRFRENLKSEMRTLAHEIAGPLPKTFTNDKGCFVKSFVNVGEREFDNIARILQQCVNREHTHKKTAIYTADRLEPETLQKFKDLRAAYELTGTQFSGCAGQLATEQEKMQILDHLLRRVQPRPLPLTPKRDPITRHRLTLPSPPPSSPMEPLPSSKLLGKRKAVQEQPTPTKRPKKVITPFPMPPPPPGADASRRAVSDLKMAQGTSQSPIDLTQGDIEFMEGNSSVDGNSDDDDDIEFVE